MGLCERCVREESTSNSKQLYEDAYSRRVVTNVTCLLEHLHRETVKRVGSGKVLDVGCGPGFLLARLSSPHREVYGIEISSAVKLAKIYATEASVCAADARKLPFKSNNFDWLLCIEVLEHIEGDEAIKECLRVLKPGGKALFSVPNKNGPGDGRTPGHVRSFTFASFVKYVQQVGFELTSARKMGLHIPILTYALRTLSLAANRNIPLAYPLDISVPELLAENFFIECRKPPI